MGINKINTNQCLLQNLRKITQCTLCKNYIYVYFHFQLKFFQLALFLQYFQYILQLIYLTTFSYTYNLNNLNTRQYHKIYRIRIYNYYHIRLYQLILFIHTYIYLHSSVAYCYKILASNLHLHLLVSCHFIFLLLKTLIFKFLKTLGAQNFAQGSLILLQLPLHLLVLILKGKKHRLFTININNFRSYFTFLIFH